MHIYAHIRTLLRVSKGIRHDLIRVTWLLWRRAYIRRMYVVFAQFVLKYIYIYLCSYEYLSSYLFIHI